MSNLIDFAKNELVYAGFDPNSKDDVDKWMYNDILELIEVFSKQGHSGSSAPYCISMFSRLASFKPLKPLTGEKDKWEDVDENIYQNKRCSEVFKDKKTGISYTVSGYVFKDQNQSYFTSNYSLKKISFPYIVKEPTYIDVVCTEVNKDTNEPEPNSGYWKTEYPDWIVKEYEELRSELSKETSTK